MMKMLSVREVEYISFRLARELMAFDEPIPEFSTRFPNILESCLAVPFQSFGGRNLYPAFLSRAAILFYLMIKKRPVQSGSKRIAMTSLLVFLAKNNKWLKADTQELYYFTIWVAQSPAGVKEETVRAIERFLKGHLSDF